MAPREIQTLTLAGAGWLNEGAQGGGGEECIEHLQLFIQKIKLHKIWYTDVKFKNKINFPDELFFLYLP